MDKTFIDLSYFAYEYWYILLPIFILSLIASVAISILRAAISGSVLLLIIIVLGLSFGYAVDKGRYMEYKRIIVSDLVVYDNKECIIKNSSVTRRTLSLECKLQEKDNKTLSLIDVDAFKVSPIQKGGEF